MLTDDTTSHLYQCSDTTRNPSSDGTSNPKPPETPSVFSDGSCGEPLFAQHVVIDFTPNEYDTKFVQKKVCSFWQFINNNPEIQNLKVAPEKNMFAEDGSSTEICSESINSEIEATNVVKGADRQSVEMLGFAEEKNLIDSIFEGKFLQTVCSLGSREYKESEVSTQPKKEKKKHVCKYTPCSNSKCRNNKKASTDSSDELSSARVLNKKMNEWDAKHPKSMEPPGHASSLQHCIIERQKFPSPL